MLVARVASRAATTHRLTTPTRIGIAHLLTRTPSCTQDLPQRVTAHSTFQPRRTVAASFPQGESATGVSISNAASYALATYVWEMKV